MGQTEPPGAPTDQNVFDDLSGTDIYHCYVVGPTQRDIGA